jgi:uncharacterized protein YbjQ (UPF0145 family)
MKDIFAGFLDIVGGQSDRYEKEPRTARDIALPEMIYKAE